MRSTRALILDVVIIGAVASAMLFWNLDNGTFSWDETQHALVTQMMYLKGRFWDLTTGFRPYYGKPPFKMWLSLIPLAIFGQSNFTFRCFDASCGVLTCLLLYWAAVRIFRSRLAGYVAAFALLGSMVFMTGHVARMAVQDSLLVLLFTGAMLIGWRFFAALSPMHAQYQHGAGGRKYRLAIALGVVTGCALFTKSVAALLIFITLGAYALLSGDFRRIVRNGLGAALVAAVIAIAIPAPYMIKRCVESHEMCRGVLATRAIVRPFSARGTRDPFPYLQGFFISRNGVPPELFLLAFVYALRRWKDHRYRYLANWALTPFLFYVLVRGRMPWYIAPALPGMSLLIGVAVARAVSALLAAKRYLRRNREQLPAAPRLRYAALTAFVCYCAVALSWHFWGVMEAVASVRKEDRMHRVVRAIQQTERERGPGIVLKYRSPDPTMKERAYLNMIKSEIQRVEHRDGLPVLVAKPDVIYAFTHPKHVDALFSAPRPVRAYAYLPPELHRERWILALSYVDQPEGGIFVSTHRKIELGKAGEGKLTFHGDRMLMRLGATLTVHALKPGRVKVMFNQTPCGTVDIASTGTVELPGSAWKQGENVVSFEFESGAVPVDWVSLDLHQGAG